MKIFMYLEAASVRGGIEIFAERHLAELRNQGHDVIVASELPQQGFGEFDEVIVHKCGDVATLEKFPAEKTTYYVHDHAPICPRSYAYTPLKRNCSRPGAFWPCIICAPACRDWKGALGRVLTQGRRKRTMARFRRIVVISQFMKSRLVANGIPSGIIDVQPPSVTVTTAMSGAKPVAEAIDILYVGQLIRGKGVQLLLQAMAKMRRQRTLDVVGTGNMEGELKDLANSLGISDRVRFRGFQTNPKDWMAAAKCVVVPSFWQEPFGLVAAEAVALGKDVVAFAIGGLPEACSGKATLVPPGDVDALAAALER